jgi:hypothetical protein
MFARMDRRKLAERTRFKKEVRLLFTLKGAGSARECPAPYSASGSKDSLLSSRYMIMAEPELTGKGLKGPAMMKAGISGLQGR